MLSILKQVRTARDSVNDLEISIFSNFAHLTNVILMIYNDHGGEFPHGSWTMIIEAVLITLSNLVKDFI